MTTWHEDIEKTGKFAITNPRAGTLSIWRKTKSGKISRNACGWDIYNELKLIPSMAKLFTSMRPTITRNHVSI